MIRVLYFGWVRELIGADGEEVAADAPVTLDALRAALMARSHGHAEALGVPARLRYAVNQAIKGPEAEAKAGDEVAIFPPVTGGCGR